MSRRVGCPYASARPRTRQRARKRERRRASPRRSRARSAERAPKLPPSEKCQTGLLPERTCSYRPGRRSHRACRTSRSPEPQRHLVLARLREEIRRIERRPGQREGVVACGVDAVDAALPGGGFRRGALAELAGGPASGKTAVALALLAALGEEELFAWVDGRGELYPPAAAARGVDLGRLLVVRPPCRRRARLRRGGEAPWRAALWASEARPRVGSVRRRGDGRAAAARRSRVPTRSRGGSRRRQSEGAPSGCGSRPRGGGCGSRRRCGSSSPRDGRPDLPRAARASGGGASPWSAPVEADVRRDGRPRRRRALLVPDLPLQRHRARPRARGGGRAADRRRVGGAGPVPGCRCARGGRPSRERPRRRRSRRAGGSRVVPADAAADRAALRALAEALLGLAPAVELATPDGLLLDASAAHLLAPGRRAATARRRARRRSSSRAARSPSRRRWGTPRARRSRRGEGRPARSRATAGDAPVTWTPSGGAARGAGGAARGGARARAGRRGAARRARDRARRGARAAAGGDARAPVRTGGRARGAARARRGRLAARPVRARDAPGGGARARGAGGERRAAALRAEAARRPGRGAARRPRARRDPAPRRAEARSPGRGAARRCRSRRRRPPRRAGSCR